MDFRGRRTWRRDGGFGAGLRKPVGWDFGRPNVAVLRGTNAARGSGTPAGVRGVLVGLPGVVATLDPRLPSGNPPGCWQTGARENEKTGIPSDHGLTISRWKRE